MVKTLSLKLNYLINRRLEFDEDIYKLLLVTIALHDIGKACKKYQESVSWDGSKCNANFKYHEIVSGALFAEVLSLVNEIDDRLKYVMTLAVFNHHYALRQLDVRCLDIGNFVIEVQKVAGHFLSDGVYIVKEVCKKLGCESRVINVLTSSFSDINTSNVMEYVKDLLRSLLCGRGYTFITSFLNHEELNCMFSTLTGVINISDVITAHCERKAREKGYRFAEHLLKELGIVCNDIID
jgi:CRISPR-associated endonuclease Cas3-HD